jgi:anti-sigma-K factor RskA
MNDPTDHIDPPDDDTLAAEYVLGVLTLSERQAVDERRTRDAVFARLIADWEERLAPWAEEVAPVAPRPALWTRIAAELPAPRQASHQRWQSLAFWRGWAIGASALALASLAALFVVMREPAPAPLVAAIDGGGHHHFVATVDPSRKSIAVVPAAYSPDATRVPELWLIAPGGKPRSLGLLRADQTVTIKIPADLAAQATDRAVLAVSLEPPGGSTTGAPTGPVIAQGKLTNL